MVDEVYKTKDQTSAHGGVCRLAWSFVWDMGDSVRFARSSAFALFRTATLGLVGWAGTLQELTHILRGEWSAMRSAMVRRIQILGDAPRRPTRGPLLTNALQKCWQIRQLAPGTHRSP